MNFNSSVVLSFKDKFSSGFEGAKANFAGMKGALDELAEDSAMTRLAADISMMTAMTDPMRQALSNALDQPSQIAGALDSSLRNIQAVTGRTAEEMSGLRKELLAVGGRAVAGPEAVTAAYYDVASGVTDVTARMATLEASVALAEAGQADLGSAAGGLIKVMNAYGYSADDAGFAADVFTATVGKGVGSMDEFVAAMSPIAGLTASVSVGFDEVGASMAYITSKGQTASAAGTQVRAAITSLLNPNQTLNRLLQSMGVESGSAMLEQYGLAESLGMIRQALGGSNDAMARALGSTEALQGAIALAGDDFEGFAASYMGGLDGITDQARGVQLESIEAKMARLEAASSALQAQVGGDINRIRGVFVDLKTRFLNAVAPIMGTPAGAVLSKLTAVVGMGTKGVLDMGSGALNAAAQLSVLTANIQNAGSITKLFGNSLRLLGGPFKPVSKLCRSFILRLFGIGGASTAAAGGTGAFGAASAGASGGIGVATAATTSFAASLWAATWPILAVVGLIALVVGGVSLLIKHWGKVLGFFSRVWAGIRGFFVAGWNWIVGLFQRGIAWVRSVIFGASGWVTAAVAVFAPFIGVPMLLIRHWDSIVSFFSGLWKGIMSGISDFIAWIGGIVGAFLAPFRAVTDGISGLFGRIFNGSKDSGAAMVDEFAAGVRGDSAALTGAVADNFSAANAYFPQSNAQRGPFSDLTGSGEALMATFAAGVAANSDLERGLDDALAHPLSPDITVPAVAPAAAEVGAPAPASITIQNLTVQADDIVSVVDFVHILQDAARVRL